MLWFTFVACYQNKTEAFFTLPGHGLLCSGWRPLGSLQHPPSHQRLQIPLSALVEMPRDLPGANTTKEQPAVQFACRAQGLEGSQKGASSKECM